MIRYRERQWIARTIWVPVLLAVAVAGLLVMVVTGDNDTIVIVAAALGVLVLIVLGFAHLTTTVDEDALTLSYVPFWRRRIALGEIATAAPRSYRPIREWGGWGIRGWGRNIAYTVHGTQGVQLVLRNGHRVLVGTHRPDELTRALDAD